MGFSYPFPRIPVPVAPHIRSHSRPLPDQIPVPFRENSCILWLVMHTTALIKYDIWAQWAELQNISVLGHCHEFQVDSQPVHYAVSEWCNQHHRAPRDSHKNMAIAQHSPWLTLESTQTSYPDSRLKLLCCVGILPQLSTPVPSSSHVAIPIAIPELHCVHSHLYGIPARETRFSRGNPNFPFQMHTPEQLKISKYALYNTTKQCFVFLGAKFRYPKFSGSPRTSELKRGTPCQQQKLDQ